MNKIYETIKNRRSIRKFTEKEITGNEIKQILDAGRWAPSGKNNQPWRFLVLTKNDSQNNKIAECTKYDRIVQQAPLLIIVLLDKQNMYNEKRDYQAAGACIQNMLLMVHALGLGGVWLGEILNKEEKVIQILNLDKSKYLLMAVLAIGRPAEKKVKDRKNLQELLLNNY